MINTTLTIVLYGNVRKEKIEYIEFHIRDEQGRPIDFNADVISFILQLC